jgi:hypothetical protein
MTYQTEFPDFDDHASAAQLLALGFADISWHNDTCPSFERGGVIVFVDYINPDLAEFGDCRGSDRFSVVKDLSELNFGNFDNLSDVIAFHAIEERGLK